MIGDYTLKVKYRPKLLVVSPVVPYPLDMACKVRILNILKATNLQFEITFLSYCDQKYISRNEKILNPSCSRIILLPVRSRKNLATRALHKAISNLVYFTAGIPPEQYYSSILNLSPKRMQNALGSSSFDLVLFEYWFASGSVERFRKAGVHCILDMHDIMWQKRVTSNNSNPVGILGKNYQNFLNSRYRLVEEATWQHFDNIITINFAEEEYVRERLSSEISIITAGTGVDLDEWPYCWSPASPPRIVFYGSLSGKENEMAALRCANKIMPLVWSKVPNAELWLIGANPSNNLRKLDTNYRIKVTGFVEMVQDVLSTATVMLCPLKGRYGFRSRLIEAMALGVPLSVTTDAVYGMGLEDGRGIYILDSDAEIASKSVKLLQNPGLAFEQSILAREQVERKFSFEATYGRIVSSLISFINERSGTIPKSIS